MYIQYIYIYIVSVYTYLGWIVTLELEMRLFADNPFPSMHHSGRRSEIVLMYPYIIWLVVEPPL